MNKKNMRALYETALRKIGCSKRILLVSPENPDIDSISCVAAFRAFLRSRFGRKVSMRAYCVDSLASLKENTLFPFIEGGNSVRDTLPSWKPDCILVFDYGNIERARLPREYEGVPIVGFDHHARQGPAPDIEIEDASFSSCTMMLYRFFSFARCSMRKNGIGKTLLAGLIADTGRFSNSGTTSEALRIAGHLDPRNEWIPMMLRASRRRIPLERLDVWREMLHEAKFDPSSGLMILVASKKDMKRWGATRRDLMAGFGVLQDIEEAKVAAVAVENEDWSWSVSLRSGPAYDIDVERIAEEFGCGGHSYAAGFIYAGDIGILLAGLKNTILCKKQNPLFKGV